MCRYICVYIRCVWMTPSHFCGEHSCWGPGLEGLVLYHISAHQLRNGVQIAALIPRLSLAGRSSAASRPISIAGHRLMESEVTAAACGRQLTTLRHTVYLVRVWVWGRGVRCEQKVTINNGFISSLLKNQEQIICWSSRSDRKNNSDNNEITNKIEMNYLMNELLFGEGFILDWIK